MSKKDGEQASIKTRAIELTHHKTGLTNSHFIHITLKILQGKEHQQKKALTKIVLNKIYEVEQPPVSLSVEVMDFYKVSYKWTLIM